MSETEAASQPSRSKRKASPNGAASATSDAGSCAPPKGAAGAAASLVVEHWPVSRLVPYVRNPRKNDGVVQRMVGLIREFGFVVPILARGDGEVIDGHLRLKAALAMGLDAVPVALADHLSPAQVKAFRLAANRSVAWAEWDQELLGLELLDLNDAGFDLSLTGFDDDEIAKALGADEGDDDELDPDDVPEDRYKEQFGVIVLCENEAHQQEAFETLKKDGWNVRVVTT